MQIFWLYPDQLEAISNILWVYHITVLPAVQEIHFACTLATTSATGLAFLMEYRHQSLISKNWHGSLHKDAKLPSCNYGHEILLRANFKSILLPQCRAARKGQLSRSVTSNGGRRNLQPVKLKVVCLFPFSEMHVSWERN